MTRDERNILARTECMLLWDHLAECGTRSKSNAIEALHAKGVLHKEYYAHTCPFCEEFLSKVTETSIDACCEKCIWPGKFGYRCENSCSPYNEWKYKRQGGSRSDLRKAARKVFKLIESIEI